MRTLDHRRLDVYGAALDFIEWTESSIDALPSGRAYLADQLRRAATSIVLNIAEGAGEYSGRAKARFYRMALRSATEAAAVLDIIRRIDLLSWNVIDEGDELLIRIVSMLTRLARRSARHGREGERERERERKRT